MTGEGRGEKNQERTKVQLLMESRKGISSEGSSHKMEINGLEGKAIKTDL